MHEKKMKTHLKPFMKKTICACSITFLLSGSVAFGQNINLPNDSIATLLCKKWEVDYAIMGGLKIGRIPGANEINYEFRKDNTFLMTTNDPKEKTKGTWSYDSKKKLIKLIINSKSNTSIISLKQDEFILLADTKETMPGDPMEIKLVYKTKS
jgi:hypothetical protein